MEALVNAAYDKISEDVILLYDAYLAFEATEPRPPLNVMLKAIRQVLREEDRKSGKWVGNSKSADDLRLELSPAKGAMTTEISKKLEMEDAAAADEELEETVLLNFLRALLTSALSDLAVLPFWAVKISAVAHRGRLPELFPFQTYGAAFAAILKAEGISGLFKGGVPVCLGGILRFFRRNRRLYSNYYRKTSHRLTAHLLQDSKYAPSSNDPEVIASTYEGVAARAMWAVLLHPFDLLSVRMITDASPQYSTFVRSVRHIKATYGLSGFLTGVRPSVLNVIVPFGNWYLLGIPFLVKTRRSLPGMDKVFRAGLGGSLDMIRDIIGKEGWGGLFAGFRATAWGMLPAFGALCASRLLVYLLLGSSKAHMRGRRRRRILLCHLISTLRGEGSGRGQGGGLSLSPANSSSMRPLPVGRRGLFHQSRGEEEER